MSASLKTRCTACNVIYDTQTAHSTTAQCPRWEPCVVETDTTDVDQVFLHPSGVAFFAYDEAAKSGSTAPAWAAATIPADCAYNREAQLVQRAADALAANAAFLTAADVFLADANVTNAEAVTQLKALTTHAKALSKQVSALIRLRWRDFSTVD